MTQDNQTQPVGLRSLPRKQVIITFGGVMLAMFLGALDQTVVGTAMPRIIADLGGFSQYTWVTTVYIITSAVVVPITGKLTDIYGRRIFYIVGLMIFVVASVLCGFSGTMNQLIIFRAIQGIGAGVIMANAFIVIGDLFPPAERGNAARPRPGGGGRGGRFQPAGTTGGRGEAAGGGCNDGSNPAR